VCGVVVDLDDQGVLRPVEVGLEAVESVVGEGKREVSCSS